MLCGHGLSLPAARAALGGLAERGLVPGPRPSDAELLGTLGIDLDELAAALTAELQATVT